MVALYKNTKAVADPNTEIYQQDKWTELLKK